MEVRAPAGGSSGSRSDENADRAPAGGSSGSRSDENADRAPVGGSSGSRSIPCKAFIFGFQARTPGRELRNSGPASGRRLSRFALHPPQSLFLRFPGANPGPEITEKADRAPAGGSYGSRSIPRKDFNFGFRARTPGRELRNRRSECRLGDQPVRAPMEKYSTKVSRRPPCCTFHYYNPERNTLSCGFMDNRRRTMDKRVDKHSCPHAYPQPCREAGYPQAPQLL